MISSPSTHNLTGFNFHVFSIVKEGTRNESYQLKVQNRSVIEAKCRIALPYDGHKLFLQFSVLPSKITIGPNETKVFTINVKVDFKKTVVINMDDLIDEKGDIAEFSNLSKSPSPDMKQFLPQVQQLNTLFGIELVETSIRIPIPVRILYKEASSSRRRDR